MYPLIFRHVFSRMDAERIHHLTMRAARLLSAMPWVLRPVRAWCAPRGVGRTVLGKQVDSPVMLAGGFDKNAEAVPMWWALGFGGVEIGTVTSAAQPGNEGTRMWRFPADRAVVNRMGFNNAGVDDAVENLRRYHRPRGFLVGGSIGKLKVVPAEDAAADYAETACRLAPHVDYLAVNVSSPNTPGLRSLQQLSELTAIVDAVQEALAQRITSPPPVLVKIAPDLNDADIADVVRYVATSSLAGVICTNTTIDFSVAPSLAGRDDVQGGLSGAPLAARSKAVLHLVRGLLPSNKTLISVGGISTPEDVQERLQMGADLVQVYSVLPYEGPFWARTVNRFLRGRVSA